MGIHKNPRLLNCWYLACLEEELREGEPLHKRILDHDIVLWKGKDGRINAIEDRCCHRNVQLSLGYLKDGCIKCAYHGWEYDGSGQCTHIPSLPESEKIPTAARVKSFAVEERYRCAWIWLGDPELKDVSRIPPMTELEELPRVYNYHDSEADLSLVAESLIDAYHINHVHRNSIKTFMGNLGGEIVDFNLEKEEDAITGTYYRTNECSIWEKIYFGFGDRIETGFGFWFPHTSKLDIRFKRRRMVIYEHFYPVDGNTVRMCQITCWHKIFNEFPLPFFAKSFMLAKSNKIVEEDLVFLKNNLDTRERTGARDMLIKSDEVTFAFHQLWKQNMEKHAKLVAPADPAETV